MPSGAGPRYRPPLLMEDAVGGQIGERNVEHPSHLVRARLQGRALSQDTDHWNHLAAGRHSAKRAEPADGGNCVRVEPDLFGRLSAARLLRCLRWLGPATWKAHLAPVHS